MKYTHDNNQDSNSECRISLKIPLRPREDKDALDLMIYDEIKYNVFS